MGQVPATLEGESLAAGNPMQTQMRPMPSLDLSSPEVHIVPNLVQAKELGVPANELGYTVNALVDGAYATDYYVGQSTSAEAGDSGAYDYIRGEKIDLNIVGSKDSVQYTQDVDTLPVATASGELVPLSTLADIRFSGGPEQVNRRERQRTITIQVTPPPAMALEDAIQRIDQKIIQPMRDSGQLGGDYTIALSGTADKLRDAWTALRGNLILATIITYLLMAALFESWTHPLVIIMSVPLGAVGGILGLRLLNVYLIGLNEIPQALDVLTMLGFIILIGTVVNNPILIVHQALNHMRDDNMNARDAVLESVRNRIRPIFITTLTTLIGLIPLVLFPGAGSELYRGLGAVVLGGIALSTAVTLIQIPSLFTLTIDLQDYLAHQFGFRLNRPSHTDSDDYATPSHVNGNGSPVAEESGILEEVKSGA
jgi:hydrophobic/amphiphilic exporter-1 (mainly G- bacteria), HAE1 family